MAEVKTREEVLATVARLIAEVVGEEWMEDRAITLETSFEKDLELESIEFVALAEKLQERYGKGVDFVGWLSGKELDEIIGLTVGELVEFIVRCP
jgi:acyl carrier protein